MTTKPRILVLHAYSADNAGDGLLVRETLELIGAAIGQADITMLASRPDSFADLGVHVLPSVPTLRGWDREARSALKNTNSFDLIVGVGGGYLRFGSATEALKAALVQGPQVLAAARSSTPSIYLPQSIGPARFATRRVLRRVLERLDRVMVRDDRTAEEIGGDTTQRAPDLATSAATMGRVPGGGVAPRPVLSIRAVRGKVSSAIYELAKAIAPYDGYIQSTVGGNDDRPASATLSPTQFLDRATLMTSGGTPRVVVAVRLHAALMALAAGHYVVHLAYERKGFGAFDDLDLSPWVHSVNRFDKMTVEAQVNDLLHYADARRDYDDRIVASQRRLIDARLAIVDQIRELYRRSTR